VNADQERLMRRKLVALIGQMDAKDDMSREGIDETIDALMDAARAGGWNPPTPNSRR